MGKKRCDLEKGVEELARVGVMGFHLGKRRTAGATSVRDPNDRSTTADTLQVVAHASEERDKLEVLDHAIDYPEGDTAESEPALAMGDTADTTPKYISSTVDCRLSILI